MTVLLQLSPSRHRHHAVQFAVAASTPTLCALTADRCRVPAGTSHLCRWSLSGPLATGPGQCRVRCLVGWRGTHLYVWRGISGRYAFHLALLRCVMHHFQRR